MNIANIYGTRGRIDQHTIGLARAIASTIGTGRAAHFLRALGVPCVSARAILCTR